MKRINFVIIFSIIIFNFVHAEKLPDFVQQRLDSVKKEAKRSLSYYRFWDTRYDGYMMLPCYLRYGVFSDDETLLIDSIDLKLNIGMIYDNEMRVRLVQLLRNEYQEDELDTLVNIQINSNISLFENDAMKICKLDTMQIFKATLDSFYMDLKNKKQAQFSISMYKYDVFKLLQLDTVTIFKQTYNNVIKSKKEKNREEWLSKTYYNYTYLAELCGYIGDKRFVCPLTEALGKPDNFQREKVLEALARMRVEPYYSDYVKKRTLTIEQIKDEKKRLDFSINDFVYVLGTQKAYLELSQYLLSNKPYQTTVIDYDDHSEYHDSPVSQDAFYLIRNNIENEDIQKIIGPYREDIDVLFKPLYDWMQKNYGKYKIRRIW